MKPRVLAAVAIVDAVAFSIGVIGSARSNYDTAFIGGSLAVVALVTLFGVFVGAGGDVKATLAITFAAVYFSFLVTIEVTTGFGARSTPAVEGSIAKVLFDNFTTLVGVVMASYFGAVGATNVASAISGHPATTDAGTVPPST